MSAPETTRTPGSEPWIYAGHCQGCGEIVEVVLGDYPEEIGKMAMGGLVVIRRSGRVTAGKECFCDREIARAGELTW